jgi:hypothetical protein
MEQRGRARPEESVEVNGWTGEDAGLEQAEGGIIVVEVVGSRVMEGKNNKCSL